MPWLIHNIFRLLYKADIKKYLSQVFVYVVVGVLSCAVTGVVCGLIPEMGITGIGIKGLVASFIGIVLQVLLFRRKEEYKATKQLIINLSKHGG